ncbi:MAG: hypothetical protein M5U25_19120 [Planctomycetota bacterium]|nr:hypothetical protein [Planctomycetota bacterium]
MPNYTTIFQVLGQYARAFTQLDNLAERNLSFSSGGEVFRSLDKLREEFVDVLNDAPAERDRLDAVGVLADAARVARGWGAQLQQSLDAWIRDALAAELNSEGASRAELLRELQRAMLADAESVAANAVSLGAVSADVANAGDAACYVSKQTVDAAENLVDDERIVNQRICIECVRDNPRHRVPVGQEEFRIRPEVGPPVSTRAIPVTYGAITDARNVVTDGAFEDDTAGVLDHWSVISGGSAFSRDTATKLFGGGSLKITGNGATSGELQQDLADRDPPLESGRFWALGAWVYVGSYSGGDVKLDLLIDGAASALTLTIDGSTPTGQWLHLGGLQYLPRGSFPNKVKVRIRCGATFNGAVYLDGVSLAPATEVPHAGLRLAIFQGAAAPQTAPVADRFTLDSTSDEAGAFQVFARERLEIALPSSGTPTISDTLAE